MVRQADALTTAALPGFLEAVRGELARELAPDTLYAFAKEDLAAAGAGSGHTAVAHQSFEVAGCAYAGCQSLTLYSAAGVDPAGTGLPPAAQPASLRLLQCAACCAMRCGACAPQAPTRPARGAQACRCSRAGGRTCSPSWPPPRSTSRTPGRRTASAGAPRSRCCRSTATPRRCGACCWRWCRRRSRRGARRPLRASSRHAARSPGLAAYS
jgi:hypothetical protein